MQVSLPGVEVSSGLATSSFREFGMFRVLLLEY